MSAVPPEAEVGGPTPRVRRDEVRRRLLDAAAEVFARRGYVAARLDEIAHAAGFTKGALYSNFAGKHALLAELIEQHVRTQVTASAEELRDLNRPDRVIEDLAELYARGIVEQGTWTRLLVEIAQRAGQDPEVREAYVEVRRALRDELATTLTRACDRLGFELTLPADQLALTLQSLRLGLALENATDPERVDEATVTAVFTDTLHGLLRRPAAAAPAADHAHRDDSADPQQLA